MSQNTSLKGQLRRIGLRYRFFCKSEIKRLADVLKSNETIEHCIYGFYNDGAVLLVATNLRILIIDKRFLFLNLDNFRYESILKVRMEKRFLAAVAVMMTDQGKIEFKSYADARLRKLCEHIIQKKYEQNTQNVIEKIENIATESAEYIPTYNITNLSSQ